MGQGSSRMSQEAEARFKRIGHPEARPLTSEDGDQALQTPRGCTDVFCVFLFLAALMGLGLILRSAAAKGDIRRVYHGISWQSELCGVDSSVADKPMLYWCSTMGSAISNWQDISSADRFAAGAAVFGLTGTLDLNHPICVESCPTDRTSYHSCFQSVSKAQSPKDVTGSFSQNFTYEFQFIQDQPSYPVADRYCLPSDDLLLQQLSSTMQSGMESAMFGAAQIVGAWHILLLSGFVAIVLGYLYLFLLSSFAGPLIYALLTSATLLPLAGGLYFLYGAWMQDATDEFLLHYDVTVNVTVPFVPTTGSKSWDTAIGIFLVLLGILAAALGCYIQRSIDMVTASLKVTTMAIFDMPSLLLTPVVHAAVRLIILSVGGVGLALVISVGDVKAVDANEYVPHGLARGFDYTDDEQLLIVGYLLVVAWIYELWLALEQFVLAYSAQLWYSSKLVLGRKQVQCMPATRGLVVGLTYNLGSLAFGSALMLLFRVLHAVLSFVYRKVQAESDEKEGTNDVAKGAAASCLCCLACWESLIRFLSKHTYTVLAIESSGFFQSAEKAALALVTESAAIGVLEGATTVFQVAGVASISGTCGWLTWLLLRNMAIFTEPGSQYFVSHPELVAAVGALVGLAVSDAFMVIFETVADSLIICWILDSTYRKDNTLGLSPNVPPQFRELLSPVAQELNSSSIARSSHSVSRVSFSS